MGHAAHEVLVVVAYFVCSCGQEHLRVKSKHQHDDVALTPLHSACVSPAVMVESDSLSGSPGGGEVQLWLSRGRCRDEWQGLPAFRWLN